MAMADTALFAAKVPKKLAITSLALIGGVIAFVCYRFVFGGVISLLHVGAILKFDPGLFCRASPDVWPVSPAGVFPAYILR